MIRTPFLRGRPVFNNVYTVLARQNSVCVIEHRSTTQHLRCCKSDPGLHCPHGVNVIATLAWHGRTMYASLNTGLHRNTCVAVRATPVFGRADRGYDYYDTGLEMCRQVLCYVNADAPVQNREIVANIKHRSANADLCRTGYFGPFARSLVATPPEQVSTV